MLRDSTAPEFLRHDSEAPRIRPDQGRSYTTLPSQSAAWRTVPAMSPRLAISSGVVTTISLLADISPSDRRISIAAARLSCTPRMTTSRSTSLHSLASPRACEPKSKTRDGWNRPTIRSTMVEMFASVVIPASGGGNVASRPAPSAHVQDSISSPFAPPPFRHSCDICPLRERASPSYSVQDSPARQGIGSRGTEPQRRDGRCRRHSAEL